MAIRKTPSSTVPPCYPAQTPRNASSGLPASVADDVGSGNGDLLRCESDFTSPEMPPVQGVERTGRARPPPSSSAFAA